MGIEVDYKRFCQSVRLAKQLLSKRELKRIDFYCANYNDADIRDATAIYEGHDRHRYEVKNFDEIFENQNVKIITIDMPLVACRPLKVSSYKDTKLFLMKTPLAKYKARSKNKWASYALERVATISDFYHHFDGLLKKRKFSKNFRKKAIRQLRDIVNSYFQE